MKKELEYTRQVNNDHLKSFGQYFTNYQVAKFMCAWACDGAKSMLDPAVGNSVFLKEARELYPDCALFGYEIDETILNYFGNPSMAKIRHADYLLNDWDKSYDAIVCNPPYNRFQAIANRNDIIDVIFEHTGMKYSSYTNLYTLFLLKSLYQLGAHGRLAYIIPTEFLNSRYGTPIKEKLLKERLVRAILNFQNDQEMFFNATTTCCILLVDREPKEEIFFYNLQSVSDLETLMVGREHKNGISVSYQEITAEQKWRSYLYQEEATVYQNLTEVGTFCKITRGIATGANDFFCFSKSKLKEKQIPEYSVIPCICRSKDVKDVFFRECDFKKLSELDKTVYVLDIKDTTNTVLSEYIKYGVETGVNKKYLVSIRKPWYSMEQRAVAPIWVCTANRNGLKFVRNLARVRSLTTFHSIYMNSPYEDYVDILFCYFLTPVAQEIIRENRKELGNGLEKFQPGDLKAAKMLDLRLLSSEDCAEIENIYQRMLADVDKSDIEKLNEIFQSYMTE